MSFLWVIYAKNSLKMTFLKTHFLLHDVALHLSTSEHKNVSYVNVPLKRATDWGQVNSNRPSLKHTGRLVVPATHMQADLKICSFVHPLHIWSRREIKCACVCEREIYKEPSVCVCVCVWEIYKEPSVCVCVCVCVWERERERERERDIKNRVCVYVCVSVSISTVRREVV